jgi:hypothetical protein
MNVDLWAAVVPVIVLALLAFVTRWPGRRSHPGMPAHLTVIVAGVPRAEAMQVRATLGEAGIATAMTGRADNNVDVLVSQVDVEAARNRLRS